MAINLLAKRRQIEISGLDELKEIDLFKDISVEYTGIAPEARLNIINNATESFLINTSYSAGLTSDLRNGYTYIITANMTEEKAEGYGYTFIDNKKQFIVEGVFDYI